MPSKDPQNWRWLADLASLYVPHIFAALMTFAVALARGVHDGGPFKKAFLGAVICTLLTVALFPVFQWLAESRGWPIGLAMAPCVFIGFLGTEWLRTKADDLYEVFIGRWRK